MTGLLLSPPTYFHAVSGMETMLHAALLCLLCGQAWRVRQGRGRTWALTTPGVLHSVHGRAPTPFRTYADLDVAREGYVCMGAIPWHPTDYLLACIHTEAPPHVVSEIDAIVGAVPRGAGQPADLSSLAAYGRRLRQRLGD